MYVSNIYEHNIYLCIYSNDVYIYSRPIRVSLYINIYIKTVQT